MDYNHWITYFDLAGIKDHATLKTRFKELLKKYHPDYNQSPDANKKTAILIETYNYLNEQLTGIKEEINLESIDLWMQEEVDEVLREKLSAQLEEIKSADEVLKFMENISERYDDKIILDLIQSASHHLIYSLKQYAYINKLEKKLLEIFPKKNKEIKEKMKDHLFLAESFLSNKKDLIDINLIIKKQQTLFGELSLLADQEELSNLSETMIKHFPDYFIKLPKDYHIFLQKRGFTVTRLGSAGDYIKKTPYSIKNIFLKKYSTLKPHLREELLRRFTIMSSCFLHRNSDFFFLIPWDFFKERGKGNNVFAFISDIEDINFYKQVNFFVYFEKSQKIRDRTGDWKNLREIGHPQQNTSKNKLAEKLYNTLAAKQEEISSILRLYMPAIRPEMCKPITTAMITDNGVRWTSDNLKLYKPTTISSIKNARKNPELAKRLEMLNLPDLIKKINDAIKTAKDLTKEEPKKGGPFKILGDLYLLLEDYSNALLNYNLASKNFPPYKSRLDTQITFCKENLHQNDKKRIN